MLKMSWIWFVTIMFIGNFTGTYISRTWIEPKRISCETLKEDYNSVYNTYKLDGKC